MSRAFHQNRTSMSLKLGVSNAWTPEIANLRTFTHSRNYKSLHLDILWSLPLSPLLSHPSALYVFIVHCRILPSLWNSTQMPGFILSSHVIDRIDYTISLARKRASERASEWAREEANERSLYPVADYIMIRLLYRARRVHGRSYIPEIATAYGATSRGDNF